MKENFLLFAACPSCGASLQLARASMGVEGEIRSGELKCEACRVAYPIRNYIPRFVSSENVVASFGFQWKRYQRTQLDTVSGKPISRERFSRTTQWTGSLSGHRILEAGCGAGRFTEVVLGIGAELVSCDLSEAVDACLDNHGLRPDWHLLQADIYHLPMRPASFDEVFCLGVLQHCPDPHKAFVALLGALRPGGRLAVDIYEQSWKLYGTPRFWLRPLVKRMPPAVTLRLIQRAAPPLMPVKRLLTRVPAVGRLLGAMIPILSYEGLLPLSPAQHREWATLDTFDALASWHENRVSKETVGRWLAQAGLRGVVDRADGFVIARATK